MIPKSLEKHITLDSIEQKFRRERSKNLFKLNPKILNEIDTLYLPFITSDSLFVNLLGEHIQYPVKLIEDTKTSLNWDILYSDQESLIYKAMLQDSDNGVAEALLNMISQTIFNEMNIKKTIDTLKIKWKKWLPDPIEWVDGSGVSRYNMITPRTLIAVLKKIHQVVGLETIKKYFSKISNLGTQEDFKHIEVYAKTGSLRHNHNLSGYWKSEKGNIYVFSIMANHFNSTSSEISEGISELLRQFQKKLK